MDLPLFDPNDGNKPVGANAYPKAGNGLLGKDPTKPDLVVATNGGSDLIYLPKGDKKLADRTVKALLEQDYVSGIFVEDKLGKLPRHAAALGSESERQGCDAAPGDRRELPLLLHGL